MLFYIITNSNQETQLETLNSLHRKSFDSSDDFSDLLIQFIKIHRYNKERPYHFDKISDVIRHIIYSFKSIKQSLIIVITEKLWREIMP